MITKMSSRGQIVIPQELREKLKADEGTVFAVEGSEDTIILKRINLPSKETLFKELERIAVEGKQRLLSQGIKEGDIPNIVQRRRLDEGGFRH
jgi:AbrB family looped-hinge helix DNA binding protein